MRQSVEHLGPQHQHVNLQIDETTIMRVCPDFEYRRYKFMEEFLRVHGRPFRKAPFDETFTKGDYSQRCYDQAAAMMLATGLIYCEGIILAELYNGRGVFPMPHAWCCKPDSTVVDPTAHKLQDSRRIFYVGVPFRPDYVMGYHRKFGWHGMLDGHPEYGDTVGPYVDHPESWRYPGL